MGGTICGVMHRISPRLTVKYACWLPKGHDGKHETFAVVEAMMRADGRGKSKGRRTTVVEPEGG